MSAGFTCFLDPANKNVNIAHKFHSSIKNTFCKWREDNMKFGFND